MDSKKASDSAFEAKLKKKTIALLFAGKKTFTLVVKNRNNQDLRT